MRGLFKCILLLVLIGLRPAQAQENGGLFEGGFWDATQMVSMSFDGPSSGIVRAAAADGFELSDGSAVDLMRWYAPRFPNLSATFLTQVNKEVAVIWGGSLGEVGQKYRISPSIDFGISWQREVGKHWPRGHSSKRRAVIQLDVFGSYGGALRETACLGDYGEIGGVQRVNCRLAASILQPEETLAYLWNQPAFVSGTIRLTFKVIF
jgi:hypothetical protein